MIKNLYSMKDVKVGFGIPFCSHSDATAIRELKVAVNAPKGSTLIADCPQDYELWKVGTIDTDTGIITPTVEFIQTAPKRDEDK